MRIFIAILLVTALLGVLFYKKNSLNPFLTVSEPAITATPTISPQKTTDQDLLGSSKEFSVYLKSGSLQIVNKRTGEKTDIKGNFTFSPNPIITDDGYNRYISISTGSSPKRTNYLISLSAKTQIGSLLCMVGQPMFWYDFIIFNNCDSFTNRPWEANLAPSIVAKSLKNLSTVTIRKSNLSRHFGIQSVNEKELTYYQTYLTTGTNWSKNHLIKTDSKTLQLSNFLKSQK